MPMSENGINTSEMSYEEMLDEIELLDTDIRSISIKLDINAAWRTKAMTAMHIKQRQITEIRKAKNQLKKFINSEAEVSRDRLVIKEVYKVIGREAFVAITKKVDDENDFNFVK